MPVSVAFGDRLAPLLSLSATEIIVEVPDGATGGPITLSVGEQTVTSNDFQLFLQPVIREVTPTAGPAGTEVTISGHYFSMDPDSNQVRFNSTEAEITQADSTRLVATVPDEATTGLIEVVTNGQATTGPTFTVSETPVPQVSIADLNPKQGPVGTTVTIDGQNFSSTNTENIVTFNGTQATISSATETSLEITVPQGATNGPVKVEVNGQTAEGPTFTVTADPDKQLTIEDLSPKEGPAGTEVTISGANFSGTAADNTVSFNGTSTTVQEASTTELVVTVPQEATSGAVTVQVGSQTAEGPTFTVTEAPVPQVTIDDISPKQGTVGSEVTINGANFGGTKSDNTVSFNGTSATVEEASTTELTVTVPEGATTGTVDVTVGDQTATGPTFTVTEEPVPQVSIEGINPKEGPVGSEVTITGQNFSATASENIVTFNGTQASLQSASTTKLVATVPEGATNGPVKVSVGSQTAEGPSFTVTADPDKELTITGINPKEGPVGSEVTITGANFSATKTNNTVTFNGTEATVSSASTTKLVADVPDGATSGPVQVSVDDQTATGPNFTITANEAPTITGEGSFTIEENTTTVATITAFDPNGDALAFSLSGGADQEAFRISESGDLAFKEADAPNFEDPGGTTYEVEVKVSDGALSVTKTITVTVTNVNEAPAITQTTYQMDEGQTDGGRIAATDPESDQIQYSIAGGPDAGALSIDASSGALTFAQAPDVETPADANTDNTYEVAITASDGALDSTQTVQVQVQNVNEAPIITSDASFEVEENTEAVGRIAASDPDGDALTFSLSGGADESWFRIDEGSGELTFEDAPDFEALPGRGDANNDDVYEVTVQANDPGGLNATQNITVEVQNVPEAPVFFRGRIDTNDGETYFARDNSDFTFDAIPAGTDLSTVAEFYISMAVDVDPITNASTDGNAFSVEPTTGGYAIELSGPTLEHSESSSSYEFTVTAQNEAGETTQTFTIPVQSPFAGGSGTDDDPYEVETVEQLQRVGQYLGAHFVQTKDIVASGGVGFEPIGANGNPFTGTYDGGGKTITGLTINRPNSNNIALFPRVDGMIKNVHLIGANITGDRRVGGLVALNFGTIQTSSATGTVTGNASTGGLVGDNGFGGTIETSYATGTVNGSDNVGGLVGDNSVGGTIETSYATGTVTGSENVGGLVGENGGSSSITRSYATGEVNGSDNVGGLVGDNSVGGTIETSYATGTVTGSENVGGLVGLNGGSVTQSYWDQETGYPSSGGGEGLDTNEMQDTAAKDNMDFDWSVWQTNTDDYPTLQQNNPE